MRNTLNIRTHTHTHTHKFFLYSLPINSMIKIFQYLILKYLKFTYGNTVTVFSAIINGHELKNLL